MLELIKSIVSPSQYMPHGHCYLWQTPLVWLHVTSDALIAIAYFSIPALLIYFVKKRGDVPFSGMFIMFGSFIILCGVGHVLEIWTLWHPAYWLSGVEQAVTALVSCYTALQLVELLPQFLALKTPDQLEKINCELEEQIAERQRTEETLQTIVAGTSAVTGNDFFPALVENLATALDVAYVMVCETVDDSLQSLRSIALWANNQLAENIEYNLPDTPCEVALAQKAICTYPNQLQQEFPLCSLIRDLNAESYVGVPLLDVSQTIIGHLCVLDTKPLQLDDRTRTLFTVFAARAAAELQRKWAEEEKRRAYEELEFRVEERTAELVAANAALESEVRERVAAEAALRQSQEHFAKAFNSNPVASSISTLKTGCFLDVNASFLNLFGYSRDEVIGKTSADLGIWAHQADRDRLVQAMRQEQSVQLDAPFRIRSGALRQGMSSFEKIELQGEPCLLSMIYDITERKQAELEQLHQMKLAALRADIGTALTEGESIQDMLNLCAIALYRHLDAAFARIWTVDDSGQTLVLQASAGLYTHLDGDHSRISVGQFKIGRIAQNRQPHLTNEVITDTQISNPEWAKREGMIAFAGYPLTIKDHLLGVMAIFAQQSLSERVLQEMGSVASAIAVGIDRKLAEIALHHTVERERAVASLFQRMRATLQLETIFCTTTKDLRRAIECDRVIIYRFNPDWSGQIVSEAVGNEWIPILPEGSDLAPLAKNAANGAECVITKLDSSEAILIEDTYLQANQGGLYRKGISCCCIPDVYQAGFNPCYLNLLEQLQARAYIIAPIFCGNQLWGLLAVYQNDAPRQWQDTEVRMVIQIGNQLGVAVQQAELFAQTQKQAEELHHAKEEADAANRAKTEFLANMSHELRTPLNAILGFTQLMQRDGSLNANNQRFVDIINQSGEHLLGLINDVLEVSKIEAGRVVLHESEFDFHNLLQGLDAMMQLKARTKGIQLVIDRAHAVPRFIRTDESKLRQVLINLVGNAVKFTQQGSVTLRVSADGNPLGQATHSSNGSSAEVVLTFEVEDTGEGIAADELDNLFQSFKQTRSGQRSQEGTGLGLRISQRFVQLMGGEITVRSEIGQGSCFSFQIRVGVAKPAAIVPARSIVQPRQSQGTAVTPGTYRILIAEDNPTNRLLLNKILTRSGFELREANNGQAAIALWQEWQPHLIFMDMHMPILDGYNATRQIRELESYKSDSGASLTKIIALTASAFAEQRRKCFAAGCDDFVSKPFRQNDLLNLVTRHLAIEPNISALALDSSVDNAATEETEYVLVPSALEIMPTEWMDQFHMATAQGNDSKCLDLIAQIPQDQTSLIKALTSLVEQYQFDELLSLTTSSLSN